MLRKQKKVVMAAAIGNALEWYDFTIYAFFVPIIAKQFFPSDDPFLSILATFGVFALGFLVRPLGAILFGYIGDYAGRKKALIISIIMMSTPTFLIGLLPNHSSIGILSPLLLTGLRIIQGLAVSGELTTATVFLIEHADPDKRGLAGSLAMTGALLGIVFSAVLATSMTELVNDEQLASWGWRIPFLLGGIIGIFGFIMRLRTHDPKVFAQMNSTQTLSVKSHIASLSYRSLSTGVCLTAIMAVANYFLIGFFNTFLVQHQGLSLRPVMVINTIAMTIQIIMTPVTGYLSDHLGRKRVLSTGMISMLILAYPIFWLLTQHDIYLALGGECLFALAASALSGVIPTTLSELFATHHRNMGLSISYNMSLALFGGTAPLVAIGLITSTGNFFAPAWYVMLCAIISFVALIGLKNTALSQNRSLPKHR